jgi:hypothetical protein
VQCASGRCRRKCDVVEARAHVDRGERDSKLRGSFDDVTQLVGQPGDHGRLEEAAPLAPEKRTALRIEIDDQDVFAMGLGRSGHVERERCLAGAALALAKGPCAQCSR